MDTRWKIGRHKLTTAEQQWATALIPAKERAVQGQAEEIKGTVVAANARGFQLSGKEAWFNWSKFAEEPRTLPAPGHNIWASLDAQGFVREVSILKVGSPRTGKQTKPATTQQVAPSGDNNGSTAPSSGVFVASQPAMHADREFRLKCLNFVVQHAGWFGVDNGEFDTVAGVTEQVQAWAEGRE